MFKTARRTLVTWNIVVFGLVLMLLVGTAYWVFESRVYSSVDGDLRSQEGRVLDALPHYGYYVSTLFANNPDLVQPEYRVVVANSSGEVNINPSECLVTTPLMPGESCPSDSLHPTSANGIKAVLTRATVSRPPAPPNEYVPSVQTFEDIRTESYSGQPWRVLSFAVAVNGNMVGIFQVARVVSGEESSLQKLRLVLASGVIIGLLLALIASWFLAGKALIPIRQTLLLQRQFTADASHELRTPLALIRANAEMLYRHTDHLPPSETDLIGEIISETDHLNRLVGDLLTLARADTDALQIAQKPVDFRTLVSDVHEDLHRIAEARGLQTGLSLNGPVVVRGDETRLRQLLLILLDNAMKYSDAGGRIDVSVARDDGRARLVVSDTGIGIPSKDLPHIFERFYRVDRAREHESGGTGLGLAIAKWIVQAHHGSIKADSTMGKGTRFQIDLPLDRSTTSTNTHQ